jgi:hypothetical protein
MIKDIIENNLPTIKQIRYPENMTHMFIIFINTNVFT